MMEPTHQSVPPKACSIPAMQYIHVANPCIYCKNDGAEFQCFLCEAFYCGSVCQSADWQNHRNHCMPRLVQAKPVRVSQEDRASNSPNPSHTPNITKMAPRKGTVLAQQPMHGDFSYPPPQDNNLKPIRLDWIDLSVPPPALSQHGEKGGKQKQQKRTKRVTPGASQPLPVASKEWSNPFPTLGRTVKISHIGENKLYIYETGKEPDGAPNRYLPFMKRLSKATSEAKQFLLAPPAKCDMVFAPFKGEYLRARVESIDETDVTVIFPDFGMTDTVAWAQLKEITDPDIKHTPPQAFEVLIDDVPKFTSVQRNFLATLLEDDDEFEIAEVITIRNSDSKAVDLLHTVALYSLSKKLQDLPTDEELGMTQAPVLVEKESEQHHPNASLPPTNEMAETATTSEPKDPTTQINLATLSLHNDSPVTVEKFGIDATNPIGDGVKLVVVDASGPIYSNIITVVLHSEMDRYNQVKDECNRIGNSDPYPYQPAQPNEACLIKRDGSWWRAVQCSKDKYLLIDLGSTYMLNENSDVRRYPAELSLDLFASDCVIDNPRTLDSYPNLSELVGKVIKADVYDKDEVFHATIERVE